MAQFIVGTEAALQELLTRTERIETTLLSLETALMANFENAVEALIDYARSLKDENALLRSNDEADAAALAAANQARMSAEEALAVAQAEIQADTAEENRLFGLITEVLPTPPEAEAEDTVEAEAEVESEGEMEAETEGEEESETMIVTVDTSIPDAPAE